MDCILLHAEGSSAPQARPVLPAEPMPPTGGMRRMPGWLVQVRSCACSVLPCLH